MTILPAKKKREKDAKVASNTSDGSRQREGCSSSSSSAIKRLGHMENGPSRKRWAISPSARTVSAAKQLPSPRSSIQPPNSSTLLDHDAKSQRGPATSRNGDYNSDDEYEQQRVRDDELEEEFAARLAARGLIIKEMEGDGACMFRAIAEQIYGDQGMHGQIRDLCMNYMANNKDHFMEFITEDFDAYIRRKREETVHGNHVELQAISEMFARPVEVYQYSDEPINVLLPRSEPTEADAVAAAPNAAQVQQNAPLRLSYHRAVHYNAIIAPNEPTVGVGLGLPGMVPGAADKELMSSALKKSEIEHIEETMLQDKIDMTDFQRTEADIEDQILRESMVSYFNDLEKARAVDDDDGPSTSSRNATSSTSQRMDGSEPSRLTLYEEMLAAQTLDWDAYTEDMAVAEALLVSQQDYMSSKPGPSNDSGGGPSTSK